MGRPMTGLERLIPMTIKVDAEIKTLVERLAAHERRTPSGSAAVLLQYGIVKWFEAQNLQRLIDEIDKGWEKTLTLRRELAKHA